MAGLDKVKLDAWADETKRSTTGVFASAQQVHALERLIDSVAQLIDENNKEIMRRINAAIGPI